MGTFDDSKTAHGGNSSKGRGQVATASSDPKTVGGGQNRPFTKSARGIARPKGGGGADGSASNRGNGSLWENPLLQRKLRGIVADLEPEARFHEDFFQEAWVQLWLSEREWSGETVSWHLQRCRFFVQDLRKAGRSLNSPKRRSHQVRLLLQAGGENEAWENLGLADGHGFMSKVSTREIIQMLGGLLGPLEKSVFQLLADGFGIREIARVTHISCDSVIKRRRKIAVLALQLGLG